jgi:2-oxoglutarate dehydrogenase complex dehydrogenase (E1) component-like enzyme
MATNMRRQILLASKSKFELEKQIANTILRYRNNEAKEGAELDHWQLNEFESIDSYPLDYRVTPTLQDKCSAIQDVKPYLHHAYMGSVGVEFDHIRSEEERLWLYENYEECLHEPISSGEKVKALQLLLRTECMEQFMQKKLPTHKRYSSEGSESITVAINALIAEASNSKNELDLDSTVLGMPHRGRLATLVVLNDYPFRNLLYKAAGANDIPEELVDRMDDMPTHIAVSNSKVFRSGDKNTSHKKTTLTMVHNPSHLESQNSISMGKVRAKLDDLNHSKRVMNIQCHGDAAFPGQGASYEALTLSKLPKFNCDGSMHIITNNQLGFTTNPEDDRSFKNSADIVKPFDVPILRVNTSDIEAVVQCCKLMIRYWLKYKKDILIDMVGFRFYGHNEVDEPSFTQPLMYKKIRSMPTQPSSYAQKLISEGVISEAEV